ncbi:MAG: FixH family protein [Caulobacter sp.]|nr:FixH family protein [Caulobacter sp.]
MTDLTQPPRFTIKGRHVLVAFVLFFGLIAAVNVVFVTLAYRTFSGQVAKNPYEAGLLYGRTLAERAAQGELGWSATIAAVGDRSVELVITDSVGKGVNGLTLDATLKRPATEVGARELSFTARGEGRYVADADLSGAWDAIVVATGPNGERFAAERRLVAP